MTQYLYQILFCSQREGRAFRREIAISETDAMVTRVESLPVGYEHAMAMMRDPREHVARLTRPVKYMSDYRGCPFCGNRTTFECGTCGSMSCLSGDADHTTCPVCHTISQVRWINEQPVSGSGFTGGRLPDRPWTPLDAPRSPPVRHEGPASFLSPEFWNPLDKFTVERPPAPRPPSVTMDPQVNAPPPVKGLLEATPEEKERLRKSLQKRLFGKK